MKLQAELKVATERILNRQKQGENVRLYEPVMLLVISGIDLGLSIQNVRLDLRKPPWCSQGRDSGEWALLCHFSTQ